MAFAHRLAITFSGWSIRIEELMISLTNSLKLREHEIRQHGKRPFGAASSRTMIAPIKDPDKIEIDSMRLQQLFDLTDREPPEEISIGAAYKIDLSGIPDASRRPPGERVQQGPMSQGRASPNDPDVTAWTAPRPGAGSRPLWC